MGMCKHPGEELRPKEPKDLIGYACYHPDDLNVILSEVYHLGMKAGK